MKAEVVQMTGKSNLGKEIATFDTVSLGECVTKAGYEHQIISFSGLQTRHRKWSWAKVKLQKIDGEFFVELRQKDAENGLLKLWPDNAPSDEQGKFLRINLSRFGPAISVYRALSTSLSKEDTAVLSAVLGAFQNAVKSIPGSKEKRVPWWDQAISLVDRSFANIGVPNTPQAAPKTPEKRNSPSAPPAAGTLKGVIAETVAVREEKEGIRGLRNGQLHGWLPASGSARIVGCWIDSKLVAVAEGKLCKSEKSGAEQLQYSITIPTELRDGGTHSFQVGLLDVSAAKRSKEVKLECPTNLTFDPASPVLTTPPSWTQKEFGIMVFGHTRKDGILAILESLKRQGVLGITHVWLDGHQGKPALKKEVEALTAAVAEYPVAKIHSHRGHFGFRKSILQAISYMTDEYRMFALLEDDCFPTANMAEVFWKELKLIENDDSIFSVYGHPFLMPSETTTCNRFQGWGWGTTAQKMRPFLRQLIECYSMPEDKYLEFVNRVMTDEVRKRIDVTAPRQPSHTLTKFFAWDETLSLLTGLQGKVHKPTNPRTVYNFGAGGDSSHFEKVAWYRKPPFNMITLDEVWDNFE